MTSQLHSAPPRDRTIALFAAALDGDAQAERTLRELALTDDLAAEALCAVAYSEALDDAEPTRPADVAATDQMIAAVFEAVAGTPQSGMNWSC
ncbi:hypothetical protein Acsp06_62490 [Actinomycetospora sp. NBRC 106375]|uniref:hypothetical protein n=1 Tax=Actinomycetospora sp. NBRC 106375 TaxID=3032207 RepID=UPI0024A17491|nr:hypothetical protein [Actinomycetospora sp. NBRC 106375]GLZ50064.1 hypothetical protein Acsp06_62490 [Actinomycetospora sp. NBRC 106375]